MSNKSHTYFSAKPESKLLDEKTYSACALNLGRICFDVFLVYEKSLIFVRRTKKPCEGIWGAGGRIFWEKFENPLQYATYSIKKHFGIEVSGTPITILKPRFLCFKERPYPEVSIWAAAKITEKQFKNITLETEEQDRILVFETRETLEQHLANLSASLEQGQAMLDLWEELEELGLLN